VSHETLSRVSHAFPGEPRIPRLRKLRIDFLRVRFLSSAARINLATRSPSSPPCDRLTILQRAAERTSVEEVRTVDQPAPDMPRGRLWRPGGGVRRVAVLRRRRSSRACRRAPALAASLSRSLCAFPSLSVAGCVPRAPTRGLPPPRRTLRHCRNARMRYNLTIGQKCDAKQRDAARTCIVVFLAGRRKTYLATRVRGKLHDRSSESLLDFIALCLSFKRILFIPVLVLRS